VEPTKNSYSVFDQLAASILKASWGSAASHIAPDDIRFLEQADYASPLRRSLGRAEVRQIIAEARSTVWPHLNEDSVRLVSPKEFTRLWSGLGVQFQLAKLKGAEGVALLGFYVRKMGGSRLPLICVNTAHHPAAVGAAFTHEMGHHLTGQLFDSGKEHAQFLANTGYREHLDDPEELAADLLVSLGVFPGPVARKILLEPASKRAAKAAAPELTDSASSAMLHYMERRYGLGFGEPESSTRKLQYLAALIHFAKLRHALLTEYDI
jgi:hypothetical protein